MAQRSESQELSRLRAVISEAAARLKRPDHACGECAPRPRRGAGIKPGFKCVRHTLLAALAAPRETTQCADRRPVLP